MIACLLQSGVCGTVQVTDLHQELHVARAECELQSYQELHLECRAIKNYTLSAELYQFQFCIKNHALLERERVESAELYQFQFCIKNHALLERERVESAELYQFQFCIKNYTLRERERVQTGEQCQNM